MNKFVQFFSRMFTSTNYADCLNAVKTKYGAIGDAIYRAPGVIVYRKKGTNDVLRITVDDFDKKSVRGSRTFRIETLFPMETTYQQYLSRVGEETGFIKTRKQVGPHRIVDSVNTVLQTVPPERYENRCAEGGLSRVYNYDNRSYFCPSTACKI